MAGSQIAPEAGNFPFEIEGSQEMVVDTRPMIRAIAFEIRRRAVNHAWSRRAISFHNYTY